jgi:uncharacterized membrane protein
VGPVLLGTHEKVRNISFYNNKDMASDDRVANMIVIFVGLIIMIIHIGAFVYNSALLFALLSIYMITYSIVMAVWLNKKKTTMTSREYNVLSYFSMFITVVGILGLIVSVWSIFASKPRYY